MTHTDVSASLNFPIREEEYVDLQHPRLPVALMALLGHVSAEMSLRYGRLFDTTVRAEYERALELAKSRLGQLPNGRTRIPVTGDGDWRDAPAIKGRLAGGYCLRAPAQGSCPYEPAWV
jgi:hypothetical protein